jgi:hypothetical protein
VRLSTLSHKWLSGVIQDALDGVAVPETQFVGLVDSGVQPRRRLSRPVLAAALGVVVVVGGPSIALAAGAFSTGPTKINTASSIPAHVGGSFPCPPMNPPPQSFAVPPPPKTPELFTTSLSHAQSLARFSIFGFGQSQLSLAKVQVQGPTTYQFCQVTITEYPTVILSYSSSSYGHITLDEISEFAHSNTDQATQTPGGGLKTLNIGSLQFIAAYTPSGLIDQVSFSSAGTQVLINFSTPEAEMSIQPLLSDLQQPPS